MKYNFQLTGANLIGGFKSNEGTVTFQTYNPTEECLLPELFYEATPQEVDLALSRASDSARFFAQTTIQARYELMHNIAKLLDLNRAELVTRFVLESGLPVERGDAELTRTISQLHEFANRIYKEEIDDDYFHSSENERSNLTKYRLPLGPVVVFGASNFPFAYSTIGGDVASALAVGCPVIVKSHPYHAGTGELVADLVATALRMSMIPRTVFSNLNAIGFEVGEQLVKDPRVKGVGFTGSFQGGMALLEYAKERTIPIPVFTEMGSINPIVVLPDKANFVMEKIAIEIAKSMSLHSGQYCTSPGLVFIPKQEFHRFEKAFVDELNENHEVEKMVHPNIAQKYHTKRKELASLPDSTTMYERVGAKPCDGGQHVIQISDLSFLDNPMYMEEVFGSFLIVVTYDSPDGLLYCLERLPGQLTGSMWFDEIENFELMRNVLFTLEEKVGRIILNGVPTGVKVAIEMNHGGPFPATSDSRFTAVGGAAINRFSRFITRQRG